MATRFRFTRSASTCLQVARVVTLMLGGVGVVALPSAVRAQNADPVAPDLENAKHSFECQLARGEFVRAGPGDNFYPTMKLEKDATVVVVGLKNNWLKILPPEGSFSYVPKAFVQVYGAGKQAKVTSQIIVKAGSALQPVKWAVQSKLEPKDSVEILGEEDEYFKIKPPQGAFLYLAKDAAVPVRQVEVAGNTVTPVPGTAVTPTNPPAVPASADVSSTPSTGTSTVTRPPTTQESPSVATETPISTPGASTRPTEADAITQLQKLEQSFSEISQKPLVDQPIGDLLAEYEKFVGTPGLADITRRMAEVRIATLKVRAEAQQQFADVQKQQQALQDRLTAQKAEKDEIQQRLKEIDIQVYAAVGTLRPSSVQVGSTQLYRLTDPQTGRTLVYVWGTSASVQDHLNQFVGIKGQVQTDPRLSLKVIHPSAVDSADPAKVNGSIAAEILPPSMVPKGSTASTTPEQ